MATSQDEPCLGWAILCVATSDEMEIEMPQTSGAITRDGEEECLYCRRLGQRDCCKIADEDILEAARLMRSNSDPRLVGLYQGFLACAMADRLAKNIVKEADQQCSGRKEIADAIRCELESRPSSPNGRHLLLFIYHEQEQAVWTLYGISRGAITTVLGINDALRVKIGQVLGN